MDAYLEEELYDLLTYCIQNPNGSVFADGGVDAMENIFYPIEFRIKEEIAKDVKPYRSWWNNITEEWKY